MSLRERDGVAQLGQHLRLDLADALARHVELLAHFLEGPSAAILQAKAQLEHASLAAAERVQHRLHLLLEDGTTREFDLAKLGMHPSLGEVTPDNLLNTWAVHDLDHVGQILAGLAGSHDAEVGPWKKYLGMLLRRTDPSAVAG